MLRAAAKTITGYEQQHNELCMLAVEGTRLANRADGSCVPEGWVGDAFATNLFQARRGLGLGLDRHASEIANCFLTNAGEEPSRKSVQAKFYNLLQSFRGSVWADTLNRKLPLWLPGGIDDWVLSPALEECLCKLLKKAGTRVAVSVIKSWANAWTTSSRMDEDEVLPCILGCQSCDDKLSHYICCDPLWTSVISSAKCTVEQLHVSPRVRLCLQNPSLESARLLTIAFSTYHALKLGNRQLVDSCIASGDFCPVQTKLLAVADAFAREILD